MGELVSNVGWAVQSRGPIAWAASGHWWLILSTILFVGISFLFLLLASWRINPIKGQKRRARQNGR